MRTAASPPARGRTVRRVLWLTPAEAEAYDRLGGDDAPGWARRTLLGDEVEDVPELRGRPRKRAGGEG